MYWNILDENRYELLKKITDNISLQNYYMIGGTALSLQLGLRESFDFDFCVSVPFNNEVIIEELAKMGEIEIQQNQKGTCDLILNGVQISFFYYPNPLIDNVIKVKEMPNLKMASIIDIAIMKIVAIGGRGSKKDFFDLYYIIQKCHISISELAEGLIRKCGNHINYVNIIMGLSYFEDAEEEILPKTYVECDWSKIKEFYLKIQPEFEKELENLRYLIFLRCGFINDKDN